MTAITIKLPPGALASRRRSLWGRLRDFVHAAITHVTAVRNSIAGVVSTATAAGSSHTPRLVIRESTTTIVSFNLSNTPFGAASSGVISANSLPISTTAVANASAVDNFRLEDRDGTLVLSGSVTAVGGGGDVEVTNTNIANGQDCSLESLTYTAPV